MIKKWIVITVKEWHILIYVFITFIFEFAQKIIDAWFKCAILSTQARDYGVNNAMAVGQWPHPFEVIEKGAIITNCLYRIYKVLNISRKIYVCKLPCWRRLVAPLFGWPQFANYMSDLQRKFCHTPLIKMQQILFKVSFNNGMSQNVYIAISLYFISDAYVDFIDLAVQ